MSETQWDIIKRMQANNSLVNQLLYGSGDMVSMRKLVAAVGAALIAGATTVTVSAGDADVLKVLAQHALNVVEVTQKELELLEDHFG